MKTQVRFKISKILLLAAKIAIGSSVAIYLAQLLHLQNITSAGTITLLTLVTTKWGTVRLAIERLITFFISVGLCFVIIQIIPNLWVDYGIYLFFLVFLSELFGWRATVSVNAIIGIHILKVQEFTFEFLLNELLLVVIGITIAFVLNLIHINNVHENGIIKNMRHVEHQMKLILTELAGYLEQKTAASRVWDDIKKLETELDDFLELAYEYQNNTFHTHTGYYTDYFEMRMKQCGALHNLHAEMRRMRQMPKQAHIVAEFIHEITKHVTEMNDPKKQMDELEQLVEELRQEPLPETQKEFESRAELYHTLMDLEEFLMYKKRFVESIDAKQFRVYWKREIEGK